MENADVTVDLEEMIQNCGDRVLFSECCIYRVPFMLRHLNEEAYTPKLVSIGPFHYGDERLKDMHVHKQIMFKRFIQRSESSLDDLVSFVKDLEPKIRASYSETINLTSHELAKLVLVDAAFIIELFIMSFKRDELQNNSKLFQQHWFWSSLHMDLVLLENQLPFSVIEKLFNKALPHIHQPSFRMLTYHYFDYFNTQELEPDPSVNINHLTDLLRLFYIQGKTSQQRYTSSEVRSYFLLYNVTALKEAGIKLKISESKCILDFRFSGHTLEIPKIMADNRTKLLFGNMLALEQCHYPIDSYIADYTLLLDCLIDTSKDVDHLIHHKILQNFLGDTNNVALLFNSFSDKVTQFNFSSEYLDICKRLNEYCEDPWHKMKATLRHDYCRTPWQIVASIAAIVLLILTIVQTIFSVLQVVK